MVKVCEEDEELKKHDWCITYDIPRYDDVTLKSNVFPQGIKKFFGIKFCNVDGKFSCEEFSGRGNVIDQQINTNDGLYVPEPLSQMYTHPANDREINDDLKDDDDEEEPELAESENIPKKKKKPEKNDMAISEELVCHYCDEMIDCGEEGFMKCSKRRCGCSVHVDCTARGVLENPFVCKFCKRGISKEVREKEKLELKDLDVQRLEKKTRRRREEKK